MFLSQFMWIYYIYYINVFAFCRRWQSVLQIHGNGRPSATFFSCSWMLHLRRTAWTVAILNDGDFTDSNVKTGSSPELLRRMVAPWYKRAGGTGERCLAKGRCDLSSNQVLSDPTRTAGFWNFKWRLSRTMAVVRILMRTHTESSDMTSLWKGHIAHSHSEWRGIWSTSRSFP